MKHLQLLFVAVAMQVPIGGIAADLDKAGKLFVGQTYAYCYNVKTWLGLSEERKMGCRSGEQIITGSFWAIKTTNSAVLVTAAHVLGVNWRPEIIDGHKLDGKTGILTNAVGRMLIGTLAYKPDRIGFIKGSRDLAFFLPKDLRMLNSVEPLELSDAPPKDAETVQIIGFPSTPYPQNQLTMTATAVREDQGFFVLNQGVEAGCSGGVVLNVATKKAYGVIVNSDKANKQTTVLRITNAMIQNIEWHQADEVLNRSF